MTQDIVKGHDSELIFRIKEYNSGKPVKINSGFEYTLLGIRIFLFSKYRDVVHKYGVDIDGNTWNTVSGYEKITLEDADNSIISIKVTANQSLNFYDGPYYVRGRLVFDVGGMPNNTFYQAVPSDLLHCGTVVGGNVLASPSIHDDEIDPNNPTE